MEEQKYNLFHKNESLRNDIRVQECLKEELKNYVSICVENSELKSLDMENAHWQIKRADFVSFFEAQDHEKYKLLIANTSIELKDSEQNQSTEEDSLHKYSVILKELVEKKQHLQKLIKEQLCEETVLKLMQEMEQSLTLLKKRNSAIMRKVLKQRQEVENQEYCLLARLKNLEKVYQDKRNSLRT